MASTVLALKWAFRVRAIANPARRLLTHCGATRGTVAALS
jgi:hypothetical protein